MIKLSLKRKMSGKAIREHKRAEEYDPRKKYDNKGLYRKNRVQKRHVENPNIYKDEKPIRVGISSIRVPRKTKKKAQKRFLKAFRCYDIDKRTNKPIFNEERWKKLTQEYATRN